MAASCLPACDRLLDADVPGRSLCVALDFECLQPHPKAPGRLNLVGPSWSATPCKREFPGHRGLLHPCGGCALDYQTPGQVWRRLRAAHRWLLFVGDSDTRGLVLDLLQVLAAAADGGRGGAEAARAQPHLWLGGQPRAPLNLTGRCGRTGWACSNATKAQAAFDNHEDWSRRCLLDWAYDSTGRVVGSRSVHCTGTIAWHYSRSERTEYVHFGRDYNLTDPAPGAGSGAGGAVRVTYVGTGHEDQTDATLRALAAQMALLPAASRPTLLYVAIGSWYSERSPALARARVERLVGRAEQLAEVVRPVAHVFGTVLGQFNRNRSVGYALARALSARWRVLNRTTPLAATTTRNGGLGGLRAATGHAPHLVNLVDLQRLLGSGALEGRDATGAGTPSCVVPRTLRYSFECGGFFHLPLGIPRERFMEAFHHYCELEYDDHRAWARRGAESGKPASEAPAAAGATLPARLSLLVSEQDDEENEPFAANRIAD